MSSLKDKLIKTYTERNGYKSKIIAKCIECAYDDVVSGNGTWRQQVENCAGVGCPLYSVRPCTTDKEEA